MKKIMSKPRRSAKVLLKLLLSAALIAVSFTVRAQSELERILDEIEERNLELAALRKLRDANIVSSRVGNSLENPEVEFGYMWGSPSTLGKNGEVSVKQAFDFPTVYSNRNKLARVQSERYGLEYQAARQQILLEAQECYIERVMRKKIDDVFEVIVAGSQKVVDAYLQKFDAGQANILELNEARFKLAEQQNAQWANRLEWQNASDRHTGLNGGRMIRVHTEDDTNYATLPEIPFFTFITDDYWRISPEMAITMLEKREAEQGIKLSRSEGLPKFFVGYKHEFGPDDKFNGLIVGMSIPLYGNRNNVKRAKAQDEYAQARIESTKERLRAWVSEMMSRMEVLNNSLYYYKRLGDQQEAAGFIQKAFDAGQISVTEYFLQLQPVYESQLAILELQREYLLVYARLNVIYL